MRDFMGIEGTVWGGIQWNIDTEQRWNDPLCIERYGYKVYSQNDEDGIIQEIFKRIGTSTKKFVEFGVGNGLECNSHYLLHRGWSGLWIEGNKGYCKEIQIKFRNLISKNRLIVKNAFITKDNINELISQNIDDIDLLSIDVDGNDYYIWKAISCVSPRAVICEYNGKFPPDYAWTQAYHSSHVWDKTDWMGASLKMLEQLGKEKGYVLVGTNANGVNAFFVRADLVGDKFIKPNSAETLFTPYRRWLRFESGHASRYCLTELETEKGPEQFYSSALEKRWIKRRDKKRKFKKDIKTAFGIRW